jgi:transcriptional regulator with XRE-family HTH domain
MEMDAAEFVRALRERHHLSQAQLAYRAGSTQQVISRIERGTMSPTLDMLARLAACCGEELGLQARARALPFEEAQLAEQLRLPMARRLELALSWDRFAGQIAGRALQALRDG